MALKFCPNCGSKLFKDANFCADCGESLEDYRSSHVDEVKSEDTAPMQEENVQVDDDNRVSKEDAQELDEETLDVDDNAVSAPVSPQLPLKQVDESKKEDLHKSREKAPIIASPQSVDESNKNVDAATPQSPAQNNDSGSKAPIKILGLNEWAFYTILLVIGISVVVGLRYYGGFGDSNEVAVVDTTKIDSSKQNKQAKAPKTVQPEVKESKPAEKVEEKSADAQVDKSSAPSAPPQSGSLTDVAYHVIISSIKELPKAKEEVKKYPGAYLIEGSFNKIAVYRSLKHEDAKYYLDSIAKKTIPDAWIFHGKAKE